MKFWMLQILVRVLSWLRCDCGRSEVASSLRSLKSSRGRKTAWLDRGNDGKSRRHKLVSQTLDNATGTIVSEMGMSVNSDQGSMID
jgi:hypothetical protein